MKLESPVGRRCWALSFAGDGVQFEVQVPTDHALVLGDAKGVTVEVVGSPMQGDGVAILRHPVNGHLDRRHLAMRCDFTGDDPARTAASNQLWAVLAEHWPGAAAVFQKLTSQITLAVSDHPTPNAAGLLSAGRMRQFCRRHSYRGGKSPAELVRRLRAAPGSSGQLRAAPGSVNPIAPSVLEAIVHGAVARIRLLNTEITRLERDLADASRLTARRRRCRRCPASLLSAWQH